MFKEFAREGSGKIAQRRSSVHTIPQSRFREDTFAVIDLNTARVKDAVEDRAAVSLGAHSHCFVC